MGFGSSGSLTHSDLRHEGEATVKCVACSDAFAVDVPALRVLIERGKATLAKDEAGGLGEGSRV